MQKNQTKQSTRKNTYTIFGSFFVLNLRRKLLKLAASFEPTYSSLNLQAGICTCMYRVSHDYCPICGSAIDYGTPGMYNTLDEQKKISSTVCMLM